MRLPLPMLLLLSAPALAAPDARVDVPGVGTVKLEHAMQSCLDGVPRGDVRVATGNHRDAAFQLVLQGVLRLEPEDRRAYFGAPEGDVWPAVDADVSVQPPLQWEPAGVVGACAAAGAWWVRRGLELAEVCPSSRAECLAAFAPEEQPVVKAALKAAKRKARHGRDPFFAALDAHDAEIEGWSSPRPYLQRACDAPQIAAGHGRFVDRDDLGAARRACLQLRLLVSDAEAPAPLDLGCDTPWRDLSNDLEHLVAAPHTDLGARAVFLDEQVDTLDDRLRRMDPSPATCSAPWASVWRGGLARLWRDAQSKGACEDGWLRLADRAHLCPDLERVATEACEAGDTTSCGVAGALYLQGLGVDADEPRGARLLAGACRAGDSRSCSELTDRVRALNRWVNQRLRSTDPAVPGSRPTGSEQAPTPPGTPSRADLDEVHAVLLDVEPHLDPEWARAQRERLFERAVEAGHAALARTTLDVLARNADEGWLDEARARVDGLPQEPAPVDEG